MTIQLDILETASAEGHPDEGTLQAWLDGELPPTEAGGVERHVAECASCGARIMVLRELASRSSLLLEGLGDHALPADRMALDAARWSVRRRRAAGKGRGMGRRSAAAAAGLVLLATGVAAAIPGSPLRSLFTEGGSSGGTEGAAALAAAATSGTSDMVGMAGVAVGLRDARVEVILEGAAPGTPVELSVGSGERVEVLAPDGTPFRAGTGSVTVQLRGMPEDRVVIRIPPGPGEVLVRAGPRNLARWHAGAFHFGEGVVAEPRSDGVRVEVPEP